MAVFDQLSTRNIWVINGRFASQSMTGVQRFAHEIVYSLDELIAQNDGAIRRLVLELVMSASAITSQCCHGSKPPESHRSGHARDQFVLPWKKNSGVLSLGNVDPIAVRNYIVCFRNGNAFVEPDSDLLSLAAYRSLLQFIESVVLGRLVQIEIV